MSGSGPRSVRVRLAASCCVLLLPVAFSFILPSASCCDSLPVAVWLDAEVSGCHPVIPIPFNVRCTNLLVACRSRCWSHRRINI